MYVYIVSDVEPIPTDDFDIHRYTIILYMEVHLQNPDTAILSSHSVHERS